MAKKLLFVALLLLADLLYCHGQVSQGGLPYSFKNASLSSDYSSVVLSSIDVDQALAYDELNQKNGVPLRVAEAVPASINLNNSGTWTKLPDGGKLWRLKIILPGARGISIAYNMFYLAPGAKLFLYNENKKQVLGAYTEENNHESGLFATEVTQGESVTLEYYEPAHILSHSIIDIAEVAYVYRNFGHFAKFGNEKDFGDADYCEVNINCSEGNNWQDEKKGVARIFIKIGANWYLCTGGLLNNVRQDCTPYFLTADHCGSGSSVSDRNQWIFHFNYEASGCSNPGTQPGNNSMTGCTLKANGGNGGNNGSDFYLVQLNSAPGFNPYYNGWTRNAPGAGGVSIHHPSGDIKKISTFSATPITDDWNGSGVNSHWRVTWIATTNGHGVSEGGSSGSPLFNAAGYVIGDLTGGGSYCSTPTQPDFYGKFSYSWDQNGSTAATRLKDWLDPDNTNAMLLAGSYCGGGTLTANFVASSTSIATGGTVVFTDLTTNSPTSWTWTITPNTGLVYQGGTNQNSQNPQIQFNTAGTYTVQLYASNGVQNDTEIKNNYITVTSGGGATCDTLRLPLTGTPTLYSVGGGGYALGNNYFGDKAKAEYFSTYAPYNRINGIMFWFGGAEGSGTAQAAAWNNSGGQPGTTFGTANVSVSTIITDVDNNYYTYVAFGTPLVIPGPFYAGVILPTNPGDTIGLVSNQDGQGIPVTGWEMWDDNSWHDLTSAWGGSLDVKMAIFPHVCQLISDQTEYSFEEEKIKIFPNPSQDIVYIGFQDNLVSNVKIKLMNTLGEIVFEKYYDGDATNLIDINPGSINPGFYFIIIESANNTVVRKLTFLK